jgi:probable rRNA maturation factor
MIMYDVSGTLPKALTPGLLRRIAKECSRLRAKTRTGTWQVGLRCVPRSKIRELNRAYCGKDRETDVLSFGAHDGDPFPTQGAGKELGDIALAPTVAREDASRRGVDPAEELVRLIAHGTLHLLGYDHADPRGEDRMFRIQEAIVEKVC